MRRSDIDIVRGLPLFRDIVPGHLDALMGAALLQKFPPHVALIREGELPDFLHVIVDGAVELFAEADGRETTIEVLQPVTTFILAAVIRDEVYLKSACTLAPSQILHDPGAGGARRVRARCRLRARRRRRARPCAIARWCAP